MLGKKWGHIPKLRVRPGQDPFFFALLRTGLSVVGFEFFDCVRYLDKADIA